MSNILINIEKGSRKCELYPKYNIEADLLEATSNFNRKWQFGIDIDGNIIFDFDENYLIANFDLLIPRKLWKVTQNLIEFPKAKKFYDLRIDSKSITIKSFNIPIKVFSNVEKNHINIAFEPFSKNAQQFPLSDKCSAFIINERTLCGFNILL